MAQRVYAHTTRLAQKAGFDGVELHSTVSYLLPKSLNDRFNLREDRYGGSIENRVRFALEILEAMISEWRLGRNGLKLNPGPGRDSLQPTEQTLPTYEYLVSQVSKMKIAYLQFQHPVGDLTGTSVEALRGGNVRHFRKFYDGLIMASGNLTK
jgi:N-ethylmaleimide reductase